MTHEIVLTSVRQGLDGDRSGFCAIAKDQHVPIDLERTLEALSGYHHFYPPESPEACDNPVVRSYFVFRQAGAVYHVLSRIGDAGIDFSLHSNHIAHHLVLSDDELTREGPAWLLAQPGFFLTEWVGPACLFHRGRPIPTQAISTVPPVLEAGESSATVTLSMTPSASVYIAPGEEPDWWSECQRQGVPDVLLKAIDQRRSVLIYFTPPMEPLVLLLNVISRLPEDERWNVPFTTCYHVPQLENAPAALVTCVPRGSNDARLRTPNPGELVIDLTAYTDGSAMVVTESLVPLESHSHEIQEIAPPSAAFAWDGHAGSGTFTVPREALPRGTTFTLRPTDAGRAIDRLLRTRSRLLFYAIYGAATLVVVLLLLMVVSRQFGWRHAASITDPLAPIQNGEIGVVTPKPPVPPIDEVPEDNARQQNAIRAEERFQTAVRDIGKVVADICDKLPSVIPLAVPSPSEGIERLPSLPAFPEFAPLFLVADALEIDVAPFFVPQDWSFITEREPRDDTANNTAPYVWTVLGCDERSKQQKPLLAITLNSDQLELSWLPDAATPPECYDAALLALGEMVLSTVDEDRTSLTAFASIPLWQVVTLPAVLLENVMEEKNAEAVVPVPIFFAKSPWKEVFAAADPLPGRDLVPFLQLEAPPLVSQTFGENLTTTSAEGVTLYEIQTEQLEPRRLEREVVKIDIQALLRRELPVIVVSDQTRLTQADEDRKAKEDTQKLVLLEEEIRLLERAALSARAEDRTKLNELKTQRDELTQEGSQNLKTREGRLETRKKAHQEVLEVVKQEKLSADFSLYLLSPHVNKKLLLQTTLTPTPPRVVPLQ